VIDNIDFKVKIADRIEVLRKSYSKLAIKESESREKANQEKSDLTALDGEISSLRNVLRGLEREGSGGDE